MKLRCFDIAKIAVKVSFLVAVLTSTHSTSVFAGEDPSKEPACYELSFDGRYWPKNPDMVCQEIVKENANTPDLYKFTFWTNQSNGPQKVSTFLYNILSQTRNGHLTNRVFGVSNNSVFLHMRIYFEAQSFTDKVEYGTLSVGLNRFHYRSAALTR